MLADFDKYGNLPEGIYLQTETEICTRFGQTSARRKWLAQSFLHLLTLAKSSGYLKRFFLWGSFVTAKDCPADLDVLIVLAKDFHIEQVPSDCKLVFDYAQAKLQFTADVFWTKESIGQDMLELWLSTYQTTRDFKRRGIIEVIL